MQRLLSLFALVPLLAACDDATGPEGTATVELRFASTTSASASAAGLAAAPAAVTVPAEGGVYEIDDIQLVVSEFELEGTGVCEVEDDDGDAEVEECEFEGGPFLVDVPLDGSPLVLATADIAEGTYTSLEFEVEDLDHDDADDEDDVEQSRIAALLAQLRGVYPTLPEGASMVVSGRFVPTTGAPQPFTVYFEAEIEIEMSLSPPLNVPTDQALTIVVDPAVWFAGVDLLELDGELVEFEVEMEDGFTEAEIDD